MDLKFRALRPEEVELRVNTISKDGATYLLYKDARCDMTVLDETVGPLGWQRHHELINGKEFCTVSIRNDTGEWVSKQDCGTESNTQKEKGESSDAFKRACTNWGIGRELYTKICVFIPGNTKDTGKKDGRGRAIYTLEKNLKYTVSHILVDGERNKITALRVVNAYGNTVFEWSEGQKTSGKVQSTPKTNQAPNPPKEAKNPSDGYVCEKCGESITEKIAGYSYSHYKKMLCMDCQQGEKNAV